MSDQPDPQEEIIETRLRHVPGDGMCQGWDVNVPYQPSVGAAGRDQPLARPNPHVRCCWPRWREKGDNRKYRFGGKTSQ